MDIACTFKKCSPATECKLNIKESLSCSVQDPPLANFLLKEHTKTALAIFLWRDIFLSFCIFQIYNNEHELFW